MPTVELSEQEWQAVINLIAQAPWHQANPLLMKIGQQLQTQQQQSQVAGSGSLNNPVGMRFNADGKEASHE
jgi:hypothetical protein